MNKKVKALLIECHRAIEQSATEVASDLRSNRLDPTYPPNAGFTSAEATAVRQLAVSPSLEAAVRKMIADASARVLFRLFNCIDGTADPEHFSEEWSGMELVEANEDGPEDMLHDQFYETYWAWLKLRKNPGWRLDTFDET